jgi:integrator complex subunit 6
MTIILFLIDTSASMSQEAFVNGVHKTYLDIAKGAVETFLKYRQRSQDCMGDRYMLLTFEEPPSNIKAGWKENHATFMNELKNLQSSGLTTVGEALKSAFDLLNLNRMQSGIDTYGQGRCPFYLEPAIIILITDGGKYSSRNGIDNTLSLPLNINIPGAKLTKEPFRWDQRLFSLILRMPGHKGDERSEGKVPHDDSPLEKMCEVTGGRSYRIKSQHVLNQCIESLVQKAQPGVVVNFDPVFKEQKDLKDGEMQELIFQNMKKMIYVHKVPGLKQFPMGYWPIPESYWPDVKMTSLPPRDAHPRVRISLQPHDEPQFVRNFPIDKYELEPNQLACWILSKKDPNKVYPMVVVNSNGANIHDPMSQYRMSQVTNEMPFGYLKANSTLMVVHYYVLPYNYQYLLALISELVLKLNLNPTSEWINKFSQYVKNIPQYYYPFLRKALTMINIPYQILQYILPETLDNYLSPTVANQLKQMKNMAKQEQENLCLRVFKQLKQPKMLAFHQHETAKLLSGQPLKMNELVKHPMLRDTFSKVHSEINLFENFNITVPTIMTSQSTKNFRNPFDIPRRDLIDEILRMRDNFFKLPTCHINLLSKDAGHSLPISEMGNYQDYLKRREAPLKELEPTNVRQHMFGNPYKRDKNMVMIDEADDIAASDPSSSNNKMMNMNKKDITRLNRKRKAGPIRKDYIFKRMRNEFGYPVSPGLPSAPSFIDSDIESDGSEISFSMDTESVGTPSESSEISKDDDLKINGIVTVEVPPIEDSMKPARQGKHNFKLKKIIYLFSYNYFYFRSSIIKNESTFT